MKVALFILLMAFVASACGVEGEEELSDVRRSPVLDGFDSPGDLGVELSDLQANAVVARVGLGCSGTVVGDRLVVTAAHCVVTNQDQWILHGAEPVVTSPAFLAHAVGTDVNDPACRLEAERVYLHPEATPVPETQRIEHDVAIILLAESVLESCLDVVPISMNVEPITEEMLNVEVLQGGYGSLDGTFRFSSQRYWSLLNLDSMSDHDISLEYMGFGFPSYGDSGSGALYRFPDGVVRALGVASTGGTGLMRFSRLDDQTSFFESLLQPQHLCGDLEGGGLCRGDSLVTCQDGEFDLIDCEAATGGVCEVDDEQLAHCTCACDSESWCEESCPCDASCPCECDTSDECDGCLCDPDCEGEVGELGDADVGGDPPDAGGCVVVARPRRSVLVDFGLFVL